MMKKPWLMKNSWLMKNWAVMKLWLMKEPSSARGMEQLRFR
ncbi:hypothetical protein ACFFON_11665 [Arthrobacter citreus]|nr:hypothetical protein [Arthrobacter gandavensis]